MNILHLDSSILGPNSVSRQLSAEIVEHLMTAAPASHIRYRDLAAEPLPHLSGATLAAAQGDSAALDPAVNDDLVLGAAVLDEFLAADVLVLGVGFYNFSIPSQVKAWVDRIVVGGKTFRYGANGQEGLAGGKRVILGIARGGVYGPGSPVAAFEHAESYLRHVFAFMGIPDVEVVAADGLAVGPEVRATSLVAARAMIAGLAA
jgi:FMN-dependent NADH-azoreductase